MTQILSCRYLRLDAQNQQTSMTIYLYSPLKKDNSTNLPHMHIHSFLFERHMKYKSDKQYWRDPKELVILSL